MIPCRRILPLAALAVILIAAFEGVMLQRSHHQCADLNRQTALVADDIRRLRQECDAARQSLEVARQRLVIAARDTSSENDARLAIEINGWLERVDRLKQLAASRPELAIPEFAVLRDKDWIDAAAAMRTMDNEEQIRDALADLRRRAEAQVNRLLTPALQHYIIAHGGMLPATASELAGYFDPPADPTLLARYTMQQQGRFQDSRNKMLLRQHSPVDPSRDVVYELGISAVSWSSAIPHSRPDGPRP